MKRNGMCPICYLRNLFLPAKRVAEIPSLPPYENGARKTPLMGWSSWNTFRGNIDEKLILETAAAMKDKGLADAGYVYVNLDDCWQSGERDSDGNLQGDLTAFPRGIAPLVDDVNKLGLKLGLYSSNGTLTCEDMPASLGREAADAQTIADWGAEYFKYDFCHNVPVPSYAPLVYAVTISKKGEADGQRYLVSNGVLDGLTRFMRNDKLPGGQFVSGLDAGKGSITFKNVTADEDGEYVLTVNIFKKGRYEKYLLAEVNGIPYEIFFPGQKHYNVTARFQTVVKLKNGSNVIKLQNPVGNKMDGAALQYRRMAAALVTAAENTAKKTGAAPKPVLFSICEWGFRKPWLWGATAGNMWRTTPDIRPVFPWIKLIYERNVKLYRCSSPGHFNDPDMLEVGNGKLTPDENKAHFALWCFMNAPLVLGNDLRSMLDSVKEIVTDKALIAINQDALLKQAKRVKKGAVDVLAKPLWDGSTAVCFFNKSVVKRTASFKLDELNKDEYVHAKLSADVSLTSVVGTATIEGGTARAEIPSHGVVAFIVK